MKLDEIKRMEEILISFLGEPKARYGNEMDGQRIFCCPRCAEENGGEPDGKYNLEINLSKNLSRGGVFQCWKCSSIDDSMKGGVLKLVRRYGGKKCYNEYRSLIQSIRDGGMYEFTEEEASNIKNEVSPIVLPQSFKKISIKTLTNKSLRAYLKKRCIDQWTINKFNIGFTEKEDNGFSYRIIIPSYDEYGHLNYFVGRDYLPENKKKNETSLSSPFNGYQRPKYKNCDADKKQIIFQESLVDWDSDITLTEGALDCIYGPNTISMLGKALSKDSALFEKLVDKAKARVILCLDNDTTIEESLKICRLLDGTKLRGRVYFIRMNEYKDFGDAFEKDGIRGIVKCLRSAEKYDRDKDI